MWQGCTRSSAELAGASLVPAQMRKGGVRCAQSPRRCGIGEPGPGVEVAEMSRVLAPMWQGCAQTQCWCGRMRHVLVQIWQRPAQVRRRCVCRCGKKKPFRGADVARTRSCADDAEAFVSNHSRSNGVTTQRYSENVWEADTSASQIGVEQQRDLIDDDGQRALATTVSKEFQSL